METNKKLNKKAILMACLVAHSNAYGSSRGTSRFVNYGTTGHYGNQYGHGGNEDHDHHDHTYGYDSIASQKYYRGDGLTRNTTIATAIQTQIDAAHQDRLDYFRDVRGRKGARLDEIKQLNELDIKAPFDYQLRLLRYEEDDILQAMGVAIIESQEAFDDMITRLERLADDKKAGLNDEIDEINQAIDRTEFDQKDVCTVLQALRVQILKNISCDLTTDPANPTATYDTTDGFEFREYEGLFDDFSYDIGHGKGTGESGNHYYQEAPGDYEVDYGASTRTWEGNLHHDPGHGRGGRRRHY